MDQQSPSETASQYDRDLGSNPGIELQDDLEGDTLQGHAGASSYFFLRASMLHGPGPAAAYGYHHVFL